MVGSTKCGSIECRASIREVGEISEKTVTTMIAAEAHIPITMMVSVKATAASPPTEVYKIMIPTIISDAVVGEIPSH